jgi:GNAT superfamily N-acetyltransferase
VEVRTATSADLPAIVALLADDGTAPAVSDRQRAAFAALDADPRNELLVLDDGGGTVLGCVQVTWIPGLGRDGAERAHVEAMRVRADRRGAGLGDHLLGHVVGRARDRGCGLVQLTSQKWRTDAHRFYAAHGFVAGHEGLKLVL